MAGEAAARGVTVQLGTDAVRNAPAAMNDLADDLAKIIPYGGKKALLTDANAKMTIPHGMGVIPRCAVVSFFRSTAFPIRVQVITLDITNITIVAFSEDSNGVEQPLISGPAAGPVNEVHWVAFR